MILSPVSIPNWSCLSFQFSLLYSMAPRNEHNSQECLVRVERWRILSPPFRDAKSVKEPWTPFGECWTYHPLKPIKTTRHFCFAVSHIFPSPRMFYSLSLDWLCSKWKFATFIPSSSNKTCRKWQSWEQNPVRCSWTFLHGDWLALSFSRLIIHLTKKDSGQSIHLVHEVISFAHDLPP